MLDIGKQELEQEQRRCTEVHGSAPSRRIINYQGYSGGEGIWETAGLREVYGTGTYAFFDREQNNRLCRTGP